MGRTKTVLIKSEKDFSEEKIILSSNLTEEFLLALQKAGRKKDTVRSYRCALRKLYDFLPEDKEITRESVNHLKRFMKDEGYSNSSINLMVSVINQLMRFCGKSDIGTLEHEHINTEPYPELTRSEYRSFLSYVQKNGCRQDYLLLKAFVVLGLHIRELSCLTAEACMEGQFDLPDGTTVLIPSSMQDELIAYCGSRGIISGPVFITRGNIPLDRSNITHRFFRLADESGLPREKCSPNSLHHLYETTQADILKEMQPIYVQLYDNLLESEQTDIDDEMQDTVNSLMAKTAI